MLELGDERMAPTIAGAILLLRLSRKFEAQNPRYPLAAIEDANQCRTSCPIDVKMRNFDLSDSIYQ